MHTVSKCPGGWKATSLSMIAVTGTMMSSPDTTTLFLFFYFSLAFQNPLPGRPSNTMTNVLDSCSQSKQKSTHTTKRPLSVLREITENSRRPSMDREDDFPILSPSPSKKRKTDSTFDNLVPLRPLSLAHPYPVPSTSLLAIQPLHEQQNTTQSRDTDASTVTLPHENVEGDEITHESNHTLTPPTRDNDTQYPDAADHPPHTIAPITVTHAPPTASDASLHSPSSPCSPPFWDIQSPIPETESLSSPPRSSSVETSSAASAPATVASNDLLCSVRPRRTTSTSTSSSSVTRRSKQNMQPRWQTQSYMVFLALRQHPARCLPRTELIKAALEMDKKISEERGLPRVFRGKVRIVVDGIKYD